MKSLLLLDVLVPLSVAATLALGVRSDGFLLLFIPFGAALIGLVAVNLAAPMILWAPHGIRALLPPVVLGVMVTVSGILVRPATDFAIAGTPISPDTYLHGSTQLELESLAGQLLDHGCEAVTTFPDEPTSVSMVPGRAEGGLGVRVSRPLRRLGIHRTTVDHLRRVVTFGRYHLRTWYEYAFAQDSLEAAYSTSPRLTMADVSDWNTFRLITAHGPGERQRGREGLGFESSMAVSYFEQALGDTFLGRFRDPRHPRRTTADDRARVVDALNRQCAAGSRLVEHSQVRIVGASPSFRIGSAAVPDPSWVAVLLRSLLHDGVLERVADGSHVRIKSPLSLEESRRVEWLHFGMMGVIYGDLIPSGNARFDRRLAAHWYFRRW